MDEDKKTLTAMITLSGDLAHNALATAVQMYQGILTDKAREVAMLQSTMRVMKAAETITDARSKSQEQIITDGRLANEMLAERCSKAESRVRVLEDGLARMIPRELFERMVKIAYPEIHCGKSSEEALAEIKVSDEQVVSKLELLLNKGMQMIPRHLFVRLVDSVWSNSQPESLSDEQLVDNVVRLIAALRDDGAKAAEMLATLQAKVDRQRGLVVFRGT